jgi:hypothetical protein
MNLSRINKQNIMKKHLKMALIIGTIFLYKNTFGQTSELSSDKIEDNKTTSHSHFDILLNVVSTNLNYGSSNSALMDSKKSISGVQIGASYQAMITPKFSIVSELYFLMKGGKLKADNPSTAQNSTLRLYTVETPLLARFSFGKVYVNAGPSIAYNLYGTNQIGDNESHSLSFTNSVGGFKRWDAGIQFGGGYTFNTKRKSVEIDLRYSYGLTNISYDQEIYNRNINIGIRLHRLRKANSLEK